MIDNFITITLFKKVLSGNYWQLNIFFFMWPLRCQNHGSVIKLFVERTDRYFCLILALLGDRKEPLRYVNYVTIFLFILHLGSLSIPLLQWEHSYDVIKSICDSDNGCGQQMHPLMFVGIWICSPFLFAHTSKTWSAKGTRAILVHVRPNSDRILCAFSQTFFFWPLWNSI